MHEVSLLRTGTAGGTLLILFANLQSADLLKTVLLAAVGAAVSFGVSWVLNRLVKKKR